MLHRFSTRRPPAAFLDEDWIVDSLKIACLLRVADAGHMDGARAPSFLLRVLQLNSISRAHWVAQNRLGRLTVNPEDPAQLIIASTSPFPRSDAAAWWVAFDLVTLFDEELRDCNDALENASGGRRTSFAAKRVMAAGQVKKFAQHVETIGWQPTESTVHVSDVSALVRKLGGEQLYGSDVDRVNVVLRELIQNAADAIRARRAVTDAAFIGCVTVRLNRRADGVFILQVDDDGVGMSRSTLSNDLLDFGRSFWAGRRAAQEFPGIHASGYASVGRFGIGFFSIFMAAETVRVFSRRFDRGLERVRCLSFENGISLRPTLSGDRPDDFGMDVCTRVELELKPGVMADPNDIEIRCNLQGHQNFRMTFNAYVAAMVAGIDAPVVVESPTGRARVHDGFPPVAGERERWLQSLSYVAAGVNQRAVPGLGRAVSRMREIRDGDRIFGLAAIDFLGQRGGLFLCAKSVRGLVSPHGRYDESFVGLIDHTPKSAKREPGEIAAPRESMDAWMTEQLALLENEGMSDIEALVASYAMCHLGHDPMRIFRGFPVASRNGDSYWPVDTIGTRLRGGERLGFAVAAEVGILEQYTMEPLRIPGIWIGVVARSGKFNAAKLSGGVPADRHSLIGVLHRVLEAGGYTPRWTNSEGVYRSFLGRGDLLEVAV